MVALAPAAAAVRQWRAWRRGCDVFVAWRQALPSAPGIGGWCRFELEVDAPAARVAAVRVRLTDLVVRVAESARRADDVYHLVCRPLGEAEALLRPVGPQVQSLGERLHSCLCQRDLDGRTQIWLVLPIELRLAQVVDPTSDDPDRPGAVDELLGRPGVRWAAACTWSAGAASVRIRTVLVVPAAAQNAAVAGIERLAGAEGFVAAPRKLW
jgi:hypothetical protein